MTCDLWWLWLLLWTNTLYYWIYWVSLGRFYLLDIHCDYFSYKPFLWRRSDARLRNARCSSTFYKPLCGVAQTPDCGIIISAFSARGVIQTLVWHLYYYSAFSARGVIQTLVWHQHYYFCIFPLEESFRHSFGTSITILHFPLEESFRHSFGTQYFVLVYF